MMETGMREPGYLLPRSIHNQLGAAGSPKIIAMVVSTKAMRAARTAGRLAGAATHEV